MAHEFEGNMINEIDYVSSNDLAVDYIEKNMTEHCRTIREGAKYLVASRNAYEVPHPAVWNEVGMIAAGLTK